MFVKKIRKGYTINYRYRNDVSTATISGNSENDEL
jgi:hypothetical protein